MTLFFILDSVAVLLIAWALRQNIENERINAETMRLHAKAERLLNEAKAVRETAVLATDPDAEPPSSEPTETPSHRTRTVD